MTNRITTAEKRQINKEFREKDDSNLWPILGSFNVTERAIKEAQRLMAYNGEFGSAFEYRSVLENIIARIVNDPKNH